MSTDNKTAATAVVVVDTACGEKRKPTAEQLAAANIDANLANLIANACLEYARVTKGPEAVAYLASSPGACLVMGMALAATYLSFDKDELEREANVILTDAESLDL